MARVFAGDGFTGTVEDAMQNLFSNEEAVKEVRNLNALEVFVVKLAFTSHKLVSLTN